MRIDTGTITITAIWYSNGPVWQYNKTHHQTCAVSPARGRAQQIRASLFSKLLACSVDAEGGNLAGVTTVWLQWCLLDSDSLHKTSHVLDDDVVGGADVSIQWDFLHGLESLAAVPAPRPPLATASPTIPLPMPLDVDGSSLLSTEDEETTRDMVEARAPARLPPSFGTRWEVGFDYDWADPNAEEPPVAWQRVEAFLAYQDAMKSSFWQWDQREQRWKHERADKPGLVVWCPTRDEID